MSQCVTWTPNTLVPTCLFGDCASNNTCICWDGFEHDRIIGRYSNCGLPSWAPLVFFSIGMITVSISILYGSFVFFRRANWKSMLWRACGASALSSFTFFLGLISLYADGFVMPWYGALFIVLGSVLSAHVAGSVLIGVLSPVAASERLGSIKRYEVFFLWLLPGFMLVCMLFSLSFGYAYDDVGLGMAFVFLSIALCASFAFPFLYSFPTRLIQALNASLSGVKVENSGRKVVKILTKVKAFRITACVSSLCTAIICFIASSFHLHFGTLPLSWVLLFAFVIILSLFHLQVEHFSLPAPPEPPSSSLREMNGIGGNWANRMSMLVSSAAMAAASPRGHRPSVAEGRLVHAESLDLVGNKSPNNRGGSRVGKSVLGSTLEERE